MIEWLKWGALLFIVMILIDVRTEICVLREDMVRIVRWYMEDDGK